MDTIVVGFDGSEASGRALEQAADLAEPLSARLVVVSVERSSRVPVAVPVAEPETVVVPSPIAGAPSAGRPVPLQVPQGPEPEHLAQQRLEQARMTLARRRVQAEYVAAVGPAADRLLEVADERNADLLVVGSREHGLLERLLDRPVDEAVARRAKRNVLLVR